MKKHLSKINLLIIVLILSIQNTYALTLDFDTSIILYMICGIFIIIGIILLIFGKISNKKVKALENDNKKNEITGLVDKDKIDRSFDPDSIFKVIPTFSNKKFFEKTFEDLKKEINKTNDIMEEVEKIDLIDKKITDFQDKEDKYIITSKFVVDCKFKLKWDDLERITYIITSENTKKATTKVITNCPNCGGKIKDTSKGRCLYCGNKFENINTQEQKETKNNWIITNITKKSNNNSNNDNNNK